MKLFYAKTTAKLLWLTPLFCLSNVIQAQELKQNNFDDLHSKVVPLLENDKENHTNYWNFYSIEAVQNSNYKITQYNRDSGDDYIEKTVVFNPQLIDSFSISESAIGTKFCRLTLYLKEKSEVKKYSYGRYRGLIWSEKVNLDLAPDDICDSAGLTFLAWSEAIKDIHKETNKNKKEIFIEETDPSIAYVVAETPALFRNKRNEKKSDIALNKYLQKALRNQDLPQNLELSILIDINGNPTISSYSPTLSQNQVIIIENAVKNMPKWSPAKQRGKLVNYMRKWEF